MSFLLKSIISKITKFLPFFRMDFEQKNIIFKNKKSVNCQKNHQNTKYKPDVNMPKR
jgi:hypothetical protein